MTGFLDNSHIIFLIYNLLMCIVILIVIGILIVFVRLERFLYNIVIFGIQFLVCLLHFVPFDVSINKLSTSPFLFRLRLSRSYTCKAIVSKN